MQKLTLLSLFLIISVLGYGQESEKYKKLKTKVKYREGYIINLDSTKVQGLIKTSLMNDAKIFGVVNFVYKDGSKANFFPGKILGFGYFGSNFISADKKFYRILIEGRKVNLYERVVKNHNVAVGAPGMPSSTYTTSSENFYLKKVDEDEFFFVPFFTFRGDLMTYFKDCPELVDAIEARELRRRDLKEMVRRYNYCK